MILQFGRSKKEKIINFFFFLGLVQVMYKKKPLPMDICKFLPSLSPADFFLPDTGVK